MSILDSHGRLLDLEAEFFCTNCNDFRDVRFADPDILCDLCAFVIATLKVREVSGGPDLLGNLRRLVGLAKSRGSLHEYVAAVQDAEAAIAKAEGRA